MHPHVRVRRPASSLASSRADTRARRLQRSPIVLALGFPPVVRRWLAAPCPFIEHHRLRAAPRRAASTSARLPEQRAAVERTQSDRRRDSCASSFSCRADRAFPFGEIGGGQTPRSSTTASRNFGEVGHGRGRGRVLEGVTAEQGLDRFTDRVDIDIPVAASGQAVGTHVRLRNPRVG